MRRAAKMLGAESSDIPMQYAVQYAGDKGLVRNACLLADGYISLFCNTKAIS
jgi:hypothetical protein